MDLMPQEIFSDSTCLYIYLAPFIYIIIRVAVILVTFYTAEFPVQWDLFYQLL